MRTTAVLAAAVLLTACQKPETPEQAMTRMQTESAAAKTAIDEINVRYARYLTSNMADSVAGLFMENGVMMPPNAPAVVGREAIQTYMTANGMPPGATISFTAVDVSANGPMVVERGTYAFGMPAQGRTPAVNVAGKYLVHWHDVNGTWLQAATIWSDDVPPMPAPR